MLEFPHKLIADSWPELQVTLPQPGRTRSLLTKLGILKGKEGISWLFLLKKAKEKQKKKKKKRITAKTSKEH